MACQPTTEQTDAIREALVEDPSSTYNGAAPPVAPACFGERFVQPEAEITRSIDLLFVTDTSASLDTERAGIANGIDAFVQALPGNVDYQIGVMLAHSSKSANSGVLWRYRNNPYVLSSKTMTQAAIRSALRENLTKGPNEYYADGGEESFYSLSKGLSATNLAASRAKGFFRENAALAVVFISDEQEICYDYPAGVTPVRDLDGDLEIKAKARDCSGISPASILAQLKKVQGERPLLVGGIVYNNQATYPRIDENEYGYGYMDLIQLASGISVDLADGNYSQGLAEIGSLATLKMRLLLDYTLARPSVNPDSIQVSVDGRTTPFEYSSAANEIHLSDGGTARSVVDINYCLMPTPSPSPSPTASSGPNPNPNPNPAPSSSPSPSPTSGTGTGGSTCTDATCGGGGGVIGL